MNFLEMQSALGSRQITDMSLQLPSKFLNNLIGN
jgi:hypothetical protein